MSPTWADRITTANTHKKSTIISQLHYSYDTTSSTGTGRGKGSGERPAPEQYPSGTPRDMQLPDLKKSSDIFNRGAPLSHRSNRLALNLPKQAFHKTVSTR